MHRFDDDCACMVKQHIVRTKCFNGSIKGSVDFRVLGHIGMKESRFTAIFADHIDCLLALFGLNIKDADLGTFFSEHQSGATSQDI